jgi:hypothetical protein
MELKGIMKNRTFWLAFLIIAFVIVFIIFIRRRGKEQEQSSFMKKIKEEAIKDKITEKEQELNQYLRKLWAEHAFWTRQYVVAYLNGSTDVNDVTKRLLKNQEQIGRSLGMWYDEKNGAKIGDLLKVQLISFGDMLNGMISKDKNMSVISEKKWHDNTEKLVDFLVEINNKWNRTELAQHFKRYNEMITNMSINRLRKKHGEEIASFDKAYTNAVNDIADSLTKGIVRQFPEQFDKLPEPEVVAVKEEAKK